MGKTIMTRLSYVITPKAELLQSLKLDPNSRHEICRCSVVITPIRDYEESFEGWHQSWISKAKHDFVTSFADVRSEDFPAFTAQLRNTSALENFDTWWHITKSDVIEIDERWSPQNGRL